MEDEFERRQAPHILDPDEDEDEYYRRHAQDMLELEDEFDRRHVQHCFALEYEGVQKEEVENFLEPYRDTTGVASTANFTFNTQLTSLHSYLGDFDYTPHSSPFLEGGAILNLPLYYLEGVILFPEATLPLRVIEHMFVAAVNRAMTQADAPYTMAVICVYKDPVDGRGPLKFSNIGTTAEIRQYRTVGDGRRINVVTRGKQRFRLRRSWKDVDGAPCAEVQIIEDVPFRTPRDVCAKLVPFSNLQSQPMLSLNTLLHRGRNDENEPTSSGNDCKLSESNSQSESPCHSDYTFTGSSTSGHKKKVRNADLGIGTKSMTRKVAGWRSHLSSTVSRAFWPIWVYHMYDSFCLAQKAADMWKQIVGKPSMDGFVGKPDLLSFYIASKIPVSESTRQELLEIDGTSHRLRRVIELLERLDRVRCKICKLRIARLGDMVVVSSDGPLGAYVNKHGFVHEVMTFRRAQGLVLRGEPVEEYSWFPGYTSTVISCVSCETPMGWLFFSTNRELTPRTFCGIMSCQVTDELR